MDVGHVFFVWLLARVAGRAFVAGAGFCQHLQRRFVSFHNTDTDGLEDISSHYLEETCEGKDGPGGKDELYIFLPVTCPRLKHLELSPYQFGTVPPELRLPQELIDLINEYITGGRPDRPHYFGSVDPAVCLVNKQWNQLFTPLLYTQFQYHGNVNKLGSFWGFLRTLVESSRLADHVQELWLTTSEIFEPFQPADTAKAAKFISKYFQMAIPAGWVLDHPPADERLRPFWARFWKAAYGRSLYHQHKEWVTATLQRAIVDDGAWHESHPDDHPSSTLPKYHRTLSIGEQEMGYLEPLRALVIGCCPNLRRLSCDDFVETRVAFNRMVSCATGFHPSAWALRRRGEEAPIRPLQKLQVLRIAGALKRLDLHIPGAGEVCRCAAQAGASRNYYNLPHVRELTVLNDCTALPWCADHGAQAIERLTINGRGYCSQVISFRVRNVRQLSLTLTGSVARRSTPPGGEPNGPRAWNRAWALLCTFKDQLEYLDLYQPPFQMKPGAASASALFDNCPLEWGDSELQPFCPPLAEFKHLRQLNLPLVGLHGYQCEHRDGQKFHNHLPPSLESIGIYTDPGEWVQQYFPFLDKELEGIALEGSREAGRLHAVVCDSAHAGSIDTRRLQAACAANGIFYSDEGNKHLFYCGRETSWGDLNDLKVCRDREARFEQRDPGRVIPRGMVVNDCPCRLRGGVAFSS